MLFICHAACGTLSPHMQSVNPQATMHYQGIISFAPRLTACADQDEDVDIGTNDEPYEQSTPAEDMVVDEKPQVSVLTVPNCLFTSLWLLWQFSKIPLFCPLQSILARIAVQISHSMSVHMICMERHSLQVSRSNVYCQILFHCLCHIRSEVVLSVPFYSHNPNLALGCFAHCSSVATPCTHMSCATADCCFLP